MGVWIPGPYGRLGRVWGPDQSGFVNTPPLVSQAILHCVQSLTLSLPLGALKNVSSCSKTVPAELAYKDKMNTLHGHFGTGMPQPRM